MVDFLGGVSVVAVYFGASVENDFVDLLVMATWSFEDLIEESECSILVFYYSAENKFERFRFFGFD